MDTRFQYKFGEDVIDPQEIVALIGNTLILGDGKEHCVDDATADAVRRAFSPYPELQPLQSTCDKALKASRSSSSHPAGSEARASKAQARLPRHSS